jgi:hypothetical protein
MMIIKFLRNTHTNGRYRSFPPEARQFWRESADIVGTVLCPVTPMTLAEVVEECRSFAAEYPEDGPYREMDEQYVAWCLVKLVEFDMAAVVLDKPEQAGGVARNTTPYEVKQPAFHIIHSQ